MPDPHRYSAHIGYLFNELPLLERPAAAHAAGFAAIEHPAPYMVPAETMAAVLRDTGLHYVQFGLRSGDAARGEKGIAIFPERRDEFHENLQEGLDYAEATNVRMIHAMAGVLPTHARRREHHACYIENLALAAEEGEKRGIRIIVEAMSSGAVPDYYLSTAAAVRDVIAEVGHRNIGLLLDIYHTVAAGDDPIREINDGSDVLAHVHIADFPGRHEPGSGTIDFDTIRSNLDIISYQGFIGCEYVPELSTSDGLGWMHG